MKQPLRPTLLLLFLLALLTAPASARDLLPKRGNEVHRIDFVSSSANTGSTGLTDYFGRFVLVSYFSSSRSPKWVERLKGWDKVASKQGSLIVWVTDEPAEVAISLFKKYKKKGVWLRVEEREDLARVLGEGPMSDGGQSVLIGPFGRVIDWDQGRILRILEASKRSGKKPARVWKWHKDCKELVKDIRKGKFDEIWPTYRRHASKSNCGETARSVIEGERFLMKGWLKVDPLAAERRARWFEKEFRGDYCLELAKDIRKAAKLSRTIRNDRKDQMALLRIEEQLFPAGVDVGAHDCGGGKCSKLREQVREYAGSKKHRSVQADAHRLLDTMAKVH